MKDLSNPQDLFRFCAIEDLVNYYLRRKTEVQNPVISTIQKLRKALEIKAFRSSLLPKKVEMGLIWGRKITVSPKRYHKILKKTMPKTQVFQGFSTSPDRGRFAKIAFESRHIDHPKIRKP